LFAKMYSEIPKGSKDTRTPGFSCSMLTTLTGSQATWRQR